jgi:PKD repeat protein
MIGAALLIPNWSGGAGSANAQEMTPPDGPRLVTFGSQARQNEGDHDFRQLIQISVPDTAGQLHLRVFDPDVGGAHDEALRGFNTQTRFSLFGAGATVRLFRDDEGIIQEVIEGEALETIHFGFDEVADDQWVTLFSFDTRNGAADGARREFVLAVEGLTGNDGNVFDVAISQSETDNSPIADIRLTSFAPTFQLAEDGLFAELRFTIPDAAETLEIENFDAAGGSIAYAGRFHSVPLTPSGKSEWRRDMVELQSGEAGRAGSVIAAGGAESPNDVTVFVGAPVDGGDSVDRPVAIDLPVRTVKPNIRPVLYYRADQTACGEMTFNASASFDTDGGSLTHIWRFDGNDDTFNGARLTRRFAETGDHRGRLEIFDPSGVVANGRATDFSFYVKPPPVAVFEAPAHVARDAEVRFDGSGSMTLPRPAGNRIERFHWRMGDGGEIIQQAGDADFGRPVYRYSDHGTFTVELTVTDARGNPCNVATATRDITVNAPPVADAGGDLQLLTGEINRFDATGSTDPDGSIASYWWDFGDGNRIFGATARHSFHRPGSYPVRLTVVDDTVFESAADTDVITVTVKDPDNMRPAARTGVDREVAIGETVAFDGSQSTDPDGRILHYLWDFGDGTGDDSPVVRHTYWEPGTYLVNLTVKDDNIEDGGHSVETITIKVVSAENRAPVLDFPSEISTTLHVPVRLDASKANDRDGAIISHEWDFGDGATGTGPVVEHRYEQIGTYSGRLVLTDDGIPQPQKTAVDFTVNVTGKANAAPVAQAGEDIAGIAGESLAFDGSGSSDTDGSILSYAWDFGDGNRATGIETRHIYQFPGRYEVKLTVTDDDVPEQRLSASSTRIVIVMTAENSAPSAVAGDDRTVGRGEIIRFDGTASADGDGNIMAYFWDFGDGGTSRHARPVHAFHDTGTYEVRLRVSDDGVPVATHEASVVVTVLDDGDGRASK